MMDILPWASLRVLLKFWPIPPDRTVEQSQVRCRYRTCFTVANDSVLPASASVFMKSLAFLLGSICTFHTKTYLSLSHRTNLLTDWYDGRTVPSFLYLRIIVWTDESSPFKHLEIVSKVESDVYRATTFCIIQVIGYIYVYILYIFIWRCFYDFDHAW